MLWDHEDDSEVTQRFKNLAFLDMPLTNAERDEVMPAFALSFLLLIAVLAIVGIGNHFGWW